MIFMAILIWLWRSDQPKIKIGYYDWIKSIYKAPAYGLACGWLGCDDSVLPASLPELFQTSHRL